ncbi:serine/threonine-protein kinase [Actinomadura sp. B10D3]|uniref:serine/threonine-protein kinase n=1 Tax=Actinomadura sp. B10D3 TaxID=3153557 RepID=UPI00325D3D55
MTEAWQVVGFVELRELGAGAQGRVVLARHEESGMPVAIKYVRADAEQKERLRDEAVLLGRVDDPLVARLYRLVESEQGAAIVMEAIDGVSLKRVLERHGALEPEAALLVLKGSLLGLAATHGVGVVHRDYKPANVVVRADGLSKLIDFGIAVPAGEGDLSGTPSYMAPEQWRGEPVVPATDVYAATCVFFECLTGRRPFRGDLAALRQAHLNAPPPLEDAPEPVRDLLARGMAKSTEERPGEAAGFVQELEAVATAAYGPDWEHRAVRALAGAAAALASLFPLAAALLPSTGGAAVSGGAAGGGAASGGTVGGTAASEAIGGTAASGGGVAGSSSAAGTVQAAGGPSGAAVSSTTGHAAGSAGTATSGGAGGTAAGGGGTTTAAGAAGAKVGAGMAIAAGVAGVALVVGGAAVVVSSLQRDGTPADRPTATAQPVAATIAEQRQTLTGQRVDVRAQYARLAGPADPAVRQRADKALRAPLDWTIQRVQPHSAEERAACTSKNSLASMTARIGVNGPSLVSVQYSNASKICWPGDGSPPGWAVTVDLKTGRAYTAEDILKPETLTGSGIRTLRSRMTVKGWPVWGPRGCLGGYPERSDFFPQQGAPLPGYPAQTPPLITVFFAPDHVEVNTAQEGSACTTETLTAPYAKVRDLLNPKIVGELPA